MCTHTNTIYHFVYVCNIPALNHIVSFYLILVIPFITVKKFMYIRYIQLYVLFS